MSRRVQVLVTRPGAIRAAETVVCLARARAALIEGLAAKRSARKRCSRRAAEAVLRIARLQLRSSTGRRADTNWPGVLKALCRASPVGRPENSTEG